MWFDPDDPRTWPDVTLVVRGGLGTLEDLARTLRRDGSWSVISAPGVPIEALAASVPNNRLRRTTVRAVLRVGGTLRPTRGRGGPPYHCGLAGLTAEAFGRILRPPEPNPVPVGKRWFPKKGSR